jgi:hypothetical protein
MGVTCSGFTMSEAFSVSFCLLCSESTLLIVGATPPILLEPSIPSMPLLLTPYEEVLNMFVMLNIARLSAHKHDYHVIAYTHIVLVSEKALS